MKNSSWNTFEIFVIKMIFQKINRHMKIWRVKSCTVNTNPVEEKPELCYIWLTSLISDTIQKLPTTGVRGVIFTDSLNTMMVTHGYTKRKCNTGLSARTYWNNQKRRGGRGNKTSSWGIDPERRKVSTRGHKRMD
jgi:hypothetical protein